MFKKSPKYDSKNIFNPLMHNGETHFKNLAVFAGRFLKCVWPFWGIIHWKVKNMFKAIKSYKTPKLFLTY